MIDTKKLVLEALTKIKKINDDADETLQYAVALDDIREITNQTIAALTEERQKVVSKQAIRSAIFSNPLTEDAVDAIHALQLPAPQPIMEIEDYKKTLIRHVSGRIHAVQHPEGQSPFEDLVRMSGRLDELVDLLAYLRGARDAQ